MSKSKVAQIGQRTKRQFISGLKIDRILIIWHKVSAKIAKNNTSGNIFLALNMATMVAKP